MTDASPPSTDRSPVPATPADAAAKLTALKADPAWTAALLQGQPAQTAEFHSLHAHAATGDSTDMAIAGKLQPGVIQNAEHLQNIGAAEMLRGLGMPDDVIKDTLNGTASTPKAFYDKIVSWKQNAMTDAEWTKKLMSGDRKARSQLAIANIIITTGPKENS
ncbi:hypothetical protein [Bradyrhizobium cytisi]|uniref:Uncharacterized protein n=1 Tax=Bradyrhizobium cytisi TaxID=515489 RepID=A0A5S4X476_9BRAD|nr:hypothetical protein [Bradyrhizobium cytisi]TYL87795.1 hypothetical protein FXB38_03175 [Bradyrhizobium cytisi]